MARVEAIFLWLKTLIWKLHIKINTERILWGILFLPLKQGNLHFKNLVPCSGVLKVEETWIKRTCFFLHSLVLHSLLGVNLSPTSLLIFCSVPSVTLHYASFYFFLHPLRMHCASSFYSKSSKSFLQLLYVFLITTVFFSFTSCILYEKENQELK